MVTAFHHRIALEQASAYQVSETSQAIEAFWLSKYKNHWSGQIYAFLYVYPRSLVF